VNSSTIQHLLELMEIDDVLQAKDVVLYNEAEANIVDLHDIRNSLVAQGYNPDKIAIVDRTNDERQDFDIPTGTSLIEYEDDYVTSYHYDAAIEIMARPENPALSDHVKNSRNWFRMKRIEKLDLNELRQELEQYEKVLIAA